jgi:riboflavin kinase/FMN adenylyltransferase
MRVARTVGEASGFGPSAVTIGNFDGVHVGHQHLFREVVRISRERGLHPTVLTFDPHPSCVVAPERAPRLLTTHEERCALMRDLGIEQVLILPFTAETARLSPREFVAGIVGGVLDAKAVLVGENFRFGHKQAGSTTTLTELGEEYGYETHIVGAVKCRGRVVSSSEVRRLIESGHVALACRCLNRPYAIAGDVIAGKGIGAKQTVPTLNLRWSAEVIPRGGVYITRTQNARRWDSITNVGFRPTFGGDPDQLSIETFLLEPLDGSPPAHIRVEFLRRVRDERKFESPEALKAQILKDVGRAQAFFRRSKRWINGSRRDL